MRGSSLRGSSIRTATCAACGFRRSKNCRLGDKLCEHVPPGSIYGPIKIEFLEAVISGLSTRNRPQLLVGDFNCRRLMEPEVVTWAQRLGKGGWDVRKKGAGFDGGRWGA